MMKGFNFLLSILLLLPLMNIFGQVNQKNIIINEVSQGSGQGTDEWIELLVTADNTDIRGVYVDVDYLNGTLGSDTAFVLSDTSAFANVSAGSIIVIYNSLVTKDPNIGPIDTDFSDGTLLIPSNNTTFLSTTGWKTSKAGGDAIGLFNPYDGAIEGIMAIAWNYSGFPDNFTQGWGYAVYTSGLTTSRGLYYNGSTASGVNNVSNWVIEDDINSTAGMPNSSAGTTNQKGIIINELSQGSGAGIDEWIELLVTEDGTDIRGVYVDADNGTGTLGDNISFELSTSNGDFASVPKGSRIVIYNSALKDTELAADDTNLLDDSTLVIPSSNTTFLSTTGWKTSFANADAIGLFNPNDGSVQGIMAIGWGNYGLIPIGNFSQGWGYAVYVPNLSTSLSLQYVGNTTSGVSVVSNWNSIADDNSSPGEFNGDQSPLPVELTSFSALINKNSVNLIWKTETEVNNYGFEIQRSIQSKDWKTLGFVNGSGNSNSPKDYSFTDNSVGTSGKYSYRLKQIDNDGSYEYSKSIEVNLGAPASIELKQNYPNPFNPSTTINFTLPVEDAVSLIVYNAIGEQVKVLYSGVLEAGVHSFNFSGDDLPSGLYVYKLSTSAGNQIRKMMLVK